MLQRGLVVAQLAFTVLLLASAGLLLRSYYNLSHVDGGFDTATRASRSTSARRGTEDRPRIGRMQLEILSALERFPGVESAGLTNFLPATGATLNYQIVLEGIAQTEESATFTTGERTVSAGYLKALEDSVARGRMVPGDASRSGFESRSRKGDGEPPICGTVWKRAEHGRTASAIRAESAATAAPDEIVGVVGDVKEDGLAASPVALRVYLSCPRALGPILNTWFEPAATRAL